MVERNSPVVIGIVLATLGALWLVLRAVTVWAAPPSIGPRRPWPMLTSPGADSDTGWRDDDWPHPHGGSADHASDVGHGGDAAGDGGGGGER